MRIGLVATYLPPHLGGIERINASLLEGYARAGHEVRCVTSRVPAHLPPREGGIVRVPCMNAAEDRLGVPIPIWGATGVRALGELAAWADVLHVVEALYQPCGLAMRAARRAGRPVIVTQNVGLVPYRSRVLALVQDLAWRTLGRWVLTRADHVVLATPTAAAFVRELLRPDLGRTSTFPVGVDTVALCPASAEERARARAALGLAGGPLVVFAGRLVEKKGVPLVLAAAAVAPELTVAVAGAGPLRPLLEGAAPNVRPLGVLDAGGMIELYRAADAVALPSRGEGLPLFVQEAMACGLPAVISEDEVYAAELLKEGVAWGAARTAGAFAARLREAVVVGPEARARVRAYAVRHWGLAEMVERHVAIARRLADAKPRP